MLIIGLKGLRGAGKSTIAKILCKELGFPIISLGEKVRGFISESEKRNTFEAILEISLRLRGNLKSGSVGELYFSEIQDYLKNGVEAIVADSIRSKHDENFFKKISPDFFMIGIYASKEERYRRIKNRKRIDDSLEWETFLKNEEREMQLLGYNCLSVPYFCIDTTGMGLNQMQKEIEKIISQIRRHSCGRDNLKNL